MGCKMTVGRAPRNCLTLWQYDRFCSYSLRWCRAMQNRSTARNSRRTSLCKSQPARMMIPRGTRQKRARGAACCVHAYYCAYIILMSRVRPKARKSHARRKRSPLIAHILAMLRASAFPLPDQPCHKWCGRCKCWRPLPSMTGCGPGIKHGRKLIDRCCRMRTRPGRPACVSPPPLHPWCRNRRLPRTRVIAADAAVGCHFVQFAKARSGRILTASAIRSWLHQYFAALMQEQHRSESHEFSKGSDLVCR